MAAYLEVAAHLAYDMFSWYKNLNVNLVFPPHGFWSGNFFLIASFPDHCLLVPFHVVIVDCRSNNSYKCMHATHIQFEIIGSNYI